MNQSIKKIYSQSEEIKQEYNDEEKLVCYYSINLLRYIVKKIIFRLQKYHDATRVITEYFNKHEISQECKINCLFMLSVSNIFEDIEIAQECATAGLNICKKSENETGTDIFKNLASKIILTNLKREKDQKYAFSIRDLQNDLKIVFTKEESTPLQVIF